MQCKGIKSDGEKCTYDTGNENGYCGIHQSQYVSEPVVEEPTVEEPTAEEPTAEEPTVEEPTVEEPTVEEPTVEEPTVEEPSDVELYEAAKEELDVTDAEEPVEEEAPKKKFKDRKAHNRRMTMFFN